MSSGALLAVCVLLTIPLVAGDEDSSKVLNCYACNGMKGTAGNSYLSCVEGDTELMGDKVCPKPAQGTMAMCLKVLKKVRQGEEVSETDVNRGCASKPSHSEDSCTTDGLVTTCYCSGIHCNGQTTLTAGMIMCFLGLACSVFISI